MTYQDFDLLIERTAAGHRATVLRSPAGQASVDVSFPFSETSLENVLLRLGRPRRSRTRRVESSEMRTAKAFGSALFDAVFTGPVAECLRASAAAVRRREGLRIRLRLADPTLHDIPWELLYNPAVNRFLALSVQTPVVRYMELPETVGPLAVDGPIRALVIIASPSDFPTLDTAVEWRHLTAALADLCQGGAVEIDRMDDASLPELQRRLRRTEYHILHFIGHGEFDPALQEGVLILEGEHQRGHRVGSQYLGMLLHDHPSLRVAILNACEGARTSRLDPFAGSAQALVQQGIPAVIAMQFEIADDVAQVLAHELYGALADGYPIDAALAEARKAIFSTGRDVEWATPVLYLRAPDGRIFAVSRTADAAGLASDAEAAAVPPAVEAQKPSGRGREAADLVRAAERALAHGRFEEAHALLERARALNPRAAKLRELADVADQQRAVAAVRTRLRGVRRVASTPGDAAGPRDGRRHDEEDLLED